MNNKFIDKKLLEFRERFDNQFPDTGERVGEIVEIAIEQFIKEALELQREECINIIEEYFNGLVLVPDPQATKQKLINKLKSEQELPRPKERKQIDPIELEKNAKGFDDECMKTKEEIFKARLAKGFCTCSGCIERDLEIEEFKEKHKLKV